MKKLIFLVMAMTLTLCPYCLAAKNADPKNDEAKRVESVKKTMETLLKKEKCTLDVIAILTAQGTQFKIQIVPVKKKDKGEKK